jgi:hypothetical protein
MLFVFGRLCQHSPITQLDGGGALYRPDIIQPIRAKLEEIQMACKDLRVTHRDGTVQAWKLRHTHVMSLLTGRNVSSNAKQLLEVARKEDEGATRAMERNTREAQFNAALSSIGIQAYPEDEFARYLYIGYNRTSLEDAVTVAKETDFLYRHTHYDEIFKQTPQHQRQKRRKHDGSTNNDRKLRRRRQAKLEALEAYSGPLMQQAKQLHHKIASAPHVTIASRFFC